MIRIASAASILLLLGATASAQTLDDLKKDGNGGSTDNMLTYGMGYHQQRYSALKQINKQTIKRLVPVWNLSLDNNWGEQAQPIVYNGVMYVTNARATVAIDVGTGKQIWKQTLDWPPETPRVVCCGVSNKGAAIYDGKIFRTTLDAHVVAYDAKTGKEAGRSRSPSGRRAYSLTLAPLIANGVHGDRQSRAPSSASAASSTATTPRSGKHLWRRYTIPGKGEKGNETWPQNSNAWEVGGGSAWITGSYDPELDLMFWGIGNSGAMGIAVAARRQPLHVVRARDPAEDRRDRLALSVHAERCLRLRRVLGTDHRREGRRRSEAQGHHAVQPQRLTCM